MCRIDTGRLPQGTEGSAPWGQIGLHTGDSWEPDHKVQLLIRHGLLQSPDAVQLEPVEGLRHLSPSKVYE